MTYKGYEIMLERQTCELFDLDDNGEVIRYHSDCHSSEHQDGYFGYNGVLARHRSHNLRQPRIIESVFGQDTLRSWHGDSGMSRYAISYAPIASEVQIDRLNKAGNLFLDDKEYHTNEALYAVCQLVIEKYAGECELVVGDKTYKITVEAD